MSFQIINRTVIVALAIPVLVCNAMHAFHASLVFSVALLGWMLTDSWNRR